MNEKPLPGTKVRLTKEFLKVAGISLLSNKIWTVEKCECPLCKTSSLVRLDEMVGKTARHVNWWNLEEAK